MMAAFELLGGPADHPVPTFQVVEDWSPIGTIEDTGDVQLALLTVKV